MRMYLGMYLKCTSNVPHVPVYPGMYLTAVYNAQTQTCVLSIRYPLPKTSFGCALSSAVDPNFLKINAELFEPVCKCSGGEFTPATANTQDKCTVPSNPTCSSLKCAIKLVDAQRTLFIAGAKLRPNDCKGLSETVVEENDLFTLARGGNVTACKLALCGSAAAKGFHIQCSDDAALLETCKGIMSAAEVEAAADLKVAAAGNGGASTGNVGWALGLVIVTLMVSVFGLI
eukprot:PhM_4_TR8318/c2_g1_i5/m.77648